MSLCLFYAVQFSKGKNLVFLAVPPVLAVLLNLIYVITSNFAEPSGFSVPFLIRQVLVYYFYLYAISKAYQLIESKTSNDKLTLAQHVLVFFLAFIVCLAVGLSTYAAMKQFYITVFHENDRINIYHLSLSGMSTLAGYILIYSVFISSRYYSRSIHLELKEEQLERERLELKYQLLSNKTNPHFLFNNLNALHTLISEDPATAEHFLVSLSKIMRYSFKTHEYDEVSLEEELAILEDYALIMKNRFGQALQLSIKNECDRKVGVLPMSLMNLMENAVKHNEVSLQNPLRIEIVIDKEKIIFTNNRTPRIVHDSSGSGLKHLREIYLQKYEREILIEKTEERFQVTVPLIQQ